MSFVKQNVNKAPIEDTVFAIVKKAKEAKAAIGAEQVVDATIGSLYIMKKGTSLPLTACLHLITK